MSKSTKWMRKGFAWLLCLIMLTGMMSSAASASGPLAPPPGPPGPGAGPEVKGTVQIAYTAIFPGERNWVDNGGEETGTLQFDVNFKLEKAPATGSYTAEFHWYKQHDAFGPDEEISALAKTETLSLSNKKKEESIKGYSTSIVDIVSNAGASGTYYCVVSLVYKSQNGTSKTVATAKSTPVRITHLVNIVFKDGGEQSDKEISLVAGELIKQQDMPSVPPAPEGKVFYGWKNVATGEYIDFSKPVTKGGTYEAAYGYKVTFDYNHPGMGTVNGQTDANGKVIKIEDPEKCSSKRHYFAGWFENKQATSTFNFNTAIEKETTIYAGWGFPVTFDVSAHSETVVSTKVVVEDQKVEFPKLETIAVEDDWKIVGWQTKRSVVSNSLQPHGL